MMTFSQGNFQHLRQKRMSVADAPLTTLLKTLIFLVLWVLTIVLKIYL